MTIGEIWVLGGIGGVGLIAVLLAIFTRAPDRHEDGADWTDSGGGHGDGGGH